MWQNCAIGRGHFLSTLLAIGLVGVAARPVSAVPVSWTSWSSFSPGAPGTGAGTIPLPIPINVGYSGEILANSYTGVGPPPLGVFTTWGGFAYSGGTVGNSPSNQGQIAISGGTSNVDTIIFSPPVVNPVMAIWSLGSANTNPAEFDFTVTEPFTIQAGGADFTTGGQSITVGASPNIVTGTEGNGVIQFTGTYSTLTWTNPRLENDYAFTIGADANVPEPASIGLLGVAALATLKRRRIR
jgi:PEP-CTERM motif